MIELQNCVSARIARYEPHWSLPGPHGAVLPSFQHVVVDADAIARPPSSATRCIVIVCYIQRESRNAWTRAARSVRRGIVARARTAARAPGRAG
eukprot:COSAG02_NODE_3286_length_7006_cov_2.000434_11_plen_94_part_00